MTERTYRTVQIRRDYSIDVPNYGEHMDIDRLIDIVKRSGSHFFDRDTMRFFKSRYDYHVYAGPDGWYFVTSEKHESPYLRVNEPRLYTVRRMSVSDDDIQLYELEGFQTYPTLTRARTAAKHAAKAGVPLCPRCKLRLTYSPICDECKQYEERHAAQGAAK